jgi:membrane associated rhomboid family serine protease
MSWQDRQYNQKPNMGGGFTGARPRASMVTWLLGLNFAILILDGVLGGSTRGSSLAPIMWGHFSIEKGVHELQLWRWLTYQFIHDGFMHLLFNMIALYFFGRLLEGWWGSRRFLAFYLLCGMSGAVLFSLLTLVPNLIKAGPNSILVGASGSIFGILAACAVLFPHQRVMLLIPPIPMSMRTLAILFLCIAFLSVIAGSQNAGGEAAHLGGAVLGWILVRRPNLLNFADGLSGLLPRKPAKRPGPGIQRQSAVDEDALVNKVLDKVRDHGLQSLTAREKKILQNATDRHSNS